MRFQTTNKKARWNSNIVRVTSTCYLTDIEVGTRQLGKHQDSRENKTNWFPEGPDMKCFVIFLDFHFNSIKRITGSNQNSRLGTYMFNDTNLILKPLNE